MNTIHDMRNRVQICLAFCLLAAATAGGQTLSISPDHPDGIYQIGQTITWHVAASGGKVGQADYVLKRCGLTVMVRGKLDLSGGSADIQASLSEPGTILAEVTTKVGEKVTRTLGGAAIAPQKVQPSSPPPNDFDAFWDEQIRKLELIPPQPDLQPADSAAANVDYFKLRMNDIAGSEIYAQMAKPKAQGKYPALLILQWAGVYGLPASRVVDRARQGWLALNVMPHDLPLDQPADVYRQLFATTLKNYWTFGSEDRDTSYFLRMYLSAYRAADYLTHRPDWDGKTLVVMGTSQGGQQTIMLAGLYPKITAMMALVPSSCDVTGPSHGRAIGYPNWADQANEQHNPKILETGRYYDPVNFARHITAPALVSMGLLDETSPATGVFAACNQMKGPKQVLVLVDSNHAGDHHAQDPFNRRCEQWLAAIMQGKPVPMEP